MEAAAVVPVVVVIVVMVVWAVAAAETEDPADRSAPPPGHRGLWLAVLVWRLERCQLRMAGVGHP